MAAGRSSDDDRARRDARERDGAADGAGTGEATGTTGGQAARPGTPVTQQIGRAVVLLLIVLFGVFAASNAQPVDFSWVFGATEVGDAPGGGTEGGVPLIALLLVSFVVGAAVGGILAWQSSRARRHARGSGSGKGSEKRSGTGSGTGSEKGSGTGTGSEKGSDTAGR